MYLFIFLTLHFILQAIINLPTGELILSILQMNIFCLRTSSEESASVCERPDVFSSFSSPLISAELLLLLALRSSFKVGPWEISSTLMRPAVRANWLTGWIELIRWSASLFQFLKQSRFNEEWMNQENQDVSSEHAPQWLMSFVLIFDGQWKVH